MEKTTLDELQDRLACFAPTKGCHPRRPLKVGIFDDILADPTIDRRTLRALLRRYCGSPSYLAALQEGAVRVALNGSAAGTVTAEQAVAARVGLRAVRAKRAERRKQARAEAEREQQAEAETRKASGLNALREAALARKTRAAPVV